MTPDERTPDPSRPGALPATHYSDVTTGYPVTTTEDVDPNMTALALFDAGWHPLPVELGKKGPPLAGWSGYDGQNRTRAEAARFDWTWHSIGARMPRDVIGIDVDAYKGGRDTFNALIEQHGPLPPTVMTTARDDGSGIRFYRSPVGRRLQTVIEPGIEIVQWFHRYAMVAPSTNPKHENRPYRWVDEQTGEVLDEIPRVEDLPELPWPWVEGLHSDGTTYKDGTTPEQVRVFIEQHTANYRPQLIVGALKALSAGSRHDTFRNVACQMYREARAGCYPASAVEQMLRPRWDQMTAGENRSGELSSMLIWAIGQAVAESSERIDKIRHKFEIPAPATVVTVNSQGGECAPPVDVNPTTGEVTIELRDEFWTARPVLEHIRQAARSRRVAPTAVLGCVLARIAAFTPPSSSVPAFVGSTSPLSLYVALIAATGGAKSTPAAVARDLMPTTPPGVIGPQQLGSGEGVADAYLEEVEVTQDGKKRRTKRQTRHGALFMLDEGKALTDMSSRSGSTILPTLCTAWSGGDLGQANASVQTWRHVKAGSYAVGLISAWQPALTGPLFDAADSGLPGRFVFLPTDDLAAPDSPPAWPGVIEWTPPPLIRLDELMPNPLDYDPAIAAEVDIERLARLRGEYTPEALDAHATLGRLKVAGLLAILDNRHAVDLEDWRLAEMIVDVSRRVRAGVMAQLHVEAARREEQANARAGRRAEVVASSTAATVESRAFSAAVRAVARKAQRHRGEVLTRRLLVHAIKGSDRQLVDVDAVIEQAHNDGYLTKSGEGWAAGGVQL